MAFIVIRTLGRRMRILFERFFMIRMLFPGFHQFDQNIRGIDL